MSKEKSSSLWPPTLAQRVGELARSGAEMFTDGVMFIGTVAVMYFEGALEERRIRDNPEELWLRKHPGELIPEPRHGDQ